jgi:hypothetical protein
VAQRASRPWNAQDLAQQAIGEWTSTLISCFLLLFLVFGWLFICLSIDWRVKPRLPGLLEPIFLLFCF